METLEAIINCVKTDAADREVRKGIFRTTVVSRFCGLSSAMMREHCPDESLWQSTPLSLTGMTAFELEQLSFSDGISKGSLGLTEMNFLIEIDESRFAAQV